MDDLQQVKYFMEWYYKSPIICLNVLDDKAYTFWFLDGTKEYIFWLPFEIKEQLKPITIVL